jgi:hypothetical protein
LRPFLYRAAKPVPRVRIAAIIPLPVWESALETESPPPDFLAISDGLEQGLLHVERIAD